MQRMPSTRSSAATKCISEVPGLAKQTLTPPPTKVRTRLSAPFMNLPPSRPISPGASVLNQKFLSTLGLDGDRTMTKPFDGGQDVVGGFGPAKGLGIGVAGVDVGGDSGLQRGSRAVGAALDLLVGEQREEALDLVDP